MLRACAFAIAATLGLSSPGCTRREGNPASRAAPSVVPDGSTPPAPPAFASASASASAPEPAVDAPFFVADPTRRAVPILRDGAPSSAYARLGRDACEAELVRRSVPFVRGEPTAGVLAPVRLRGPLHGVAIHTERGAKERETSIYEIFDCRLVLALDDFSELLARHDVVEIIHFNAYRPKSQHGCTARYWGLQHCAALAVDVGKLKRRDGSVLEVLRDFHGRIGLATCAKDVGPAPATPAAAELWSMVCDAARRALFHVMLTPNYNAEHRNHFHLEVTPEASWMMVK